MPAGIGNLLTGRRLAYGVAFAVDVWGGVDMKRYGSALILSVAFCLSGCSREPADTRVADERAIRATDAAMLTAAQAKDADRVVATYASDATLLPPNEPMVTGKDGIRAGWARAMAIPGFDINWQILKFDISRSGDLAYTTATYVSAMQDATGKAVSDNGKDIEVWKKQADGSWKVEADSFNSDLPVVAPAKAPVAKPSAKKHHSKRRHRAQ
jgi:uncharacterized protein (TIGR02246 family)